MAEGVNEYEEGRIEQQKEEYVKSSLRELGDMVQDQIDDNQILSPEEIERRIERRVAKRGQIDVAKLKQVENEIKAAIKRLEGKETNDEKLEKRKCKDRKVRTIMRERAIHIDTSENPETRATIFQKAEKFVKDYILKQHISEKMVVRVGYVDITSSDGSRTKTQHRYSNYPLTVPLRYKLLTELHCSSGKSGIVTDYVDYSGPGGNNNNNNNNSTKSDEGCADDILGVPGGGEGSGTFLTVVSSIEFRRMAPTNKDYNRLEPFEGNSKKEYFIPNERELCYLEEYKRRMGEFFPFYIDEKVHRYIQGEMTFAQIYSLNIYSSQKRCKENFKECCFVFALKQLGVDKNIIYDIQTRIFDRNITFSHVNQLCINNKIKLTLKCMDEELVNTHRSKKASNIQGYKGKDPKYNIELYCFQNHYFANRRTKISNSWLEHSLAGEDIEHIPTNYVWDSSKQKWRNPPSSNPTLMLDKLILKLWKTKKFIPLTYQHLLNIPSIEKPNIDDETDLS